MFAKSILWLPGTGTIDWKGCDESPLLGLQHPLMERVWNKRRHSVQISASPMPVLVLDTIQSFSRYSIFFLSSCHSYFSNLIFRVHSLYEIKSSRSRWFMNKTPFFEIWQMWYCRMSPLGFYWKDGKYHKRGSKSPLYYLQRPYSLTYLGQKS